MRAALEEYGGREMKHMGDGIMASFPSAVAAVTAALAMQRELADGEVRVRIGLNAGEPIAEDDDLFGTAVQLAARITDRASSGQTSVGEPAAKVDLVAEHLRRINPAAAIRTFRMSVVLDDAAAALLDRDVIFLCTDDHWGRSIVNQVAYQYLIPVINLGVRISAGKGTITAAAGVVDILRPDVPCLWCRQFLRAERIAAESMPADARESLEAEGYVEGIDAPAPSVMSITTTLSGMAVTQFLQLLTDFMGQTGGVERLNYDVIEGTVRRGRATIVPGCICQSVRGRRDLTPLPTVAHLDHVDPEGRAESGE